MKVTRRAEFSASHICSSPQLSPDENRAIYGEGANPHGHGHNYVLEVTVEGEPDPVTGMVMDLKHLKQVIQEEVIDPMDHRFLNREVAPFDRVIPTAENLAMEIWRRLAPRLASDKTRLDCVRLFETEDLYVEYRGELA
ncbi:MAG: 6-carboxytetrahydropterin synthase [Bryobacteraceae bacterium]|nr:6-carboxytetrahydropterin synthase [Bryobacteraceae bacterium]MDW8376743.1 6-carboxytetrahydropterin synthase [Bryobacterales bacterium]